MTVTLLIAPLLAACDSSTGPEEPSAPTLDDVQAQVFSTKCVSCHSGAAAAAGLSLEAGDAYDNIVSVSSTQVPDLLTVAPGSAANSYLFIKITGGERIAPNTFRMPIGEALSEDDIDLVESWIDGGANR